MTAASRSIIQVRNLRVEFATRSGSVVGVDNLSFDVKAGETVCVVGESGSGKSVSALSIMRLIDWDGGNVCQGEILLDRGPGNAPTDVLQSDQETVRGLRGNDIGMIFQEPMTALNPVFTVGSQLIEGLRLHQKLDSATARKRAIALLRDVRIPEPERRFDQYPHELSGGMRQRVVIAMALASQPRLLIADEPTTALDVSIQAEVLSLIGELKETHNTAVILITHDMAVVAQIADRVVVMYKGRKVEEGAVTDIFADPQHDYTKALLSAVPKLGEMAGTSAPEALRILGQAQKSTTPVLGTTEPLLEVTGLTKHFPVSGGLLRRTVARVHALEDVSFVLNRGQTLSLVGESGSGKSTAVRSVLRLVEPTSGEVTLDGVDIMALEREQLRHARRDMQMIFQDPFASLNPKMRLQEQVAAPLRNFDDESKDDIMDRVAELFDRVQLPRSFMRRYPHEMSGGQRQRIAIARALALNPKLIVADEAVSALDVSVQAHILNLMMELQADLGLSFLFVSHDMAVVERISHTVAVMYLGRIVEIGPRNKVFGDPAHPYTRALIEAVPIADPAKRKPYVQSARPIPSPIHKADYVPAPNEYAELEPGHLMLVSDSGYEAS